MASLDSPLQSSPISRHRCLSVRFGDTCVLIPDLPPRVRPRIVTKSYSLPLWKNPSTTSRKSVSDGSDGGDPPTNEAERKPFSLTVSVPSLTIARPRRPSLPPASPCLSRRYMQGVPESPLESPVSPHKNVTSFPQTEHILVNSTLNTVPLRSCCGVCHTSVDKALAEGEQWSAQWSRGAIRRHTTGETSLFGVSRVWRPHAADVPLAEALRVDEIEAKHHSHSLKSVTLNHRPLPPLLSSESSSEEELDGEQTDPFLDAITSFERVANNTLEINAIPDKANDIPVCEPKIPDPDVVLSSPTIQRQRSLSPRPQGRRPSFTAASQSFIKGSASILRGVAVGVSGVSAVR